MDGEHEKGIGESGERRAVTYCLIPVELAPKLHDLLCRHFADDPTVEAIVERRGRERRRTPERRAGDDEAAPGPERRKVRGAGGRRAGERRVKLVPAEPRELPRRARRYADQLVFVERFEPVGDRMEDLDTARTVARFQAGDGDAFDVLYTRYFDRVYGYLRVALRDPHEAEDLTQQVFLDAFEALPGYERRRQPFRAWLFSIARNRGIDRLRREHRLEVTDPAELDRKREEMAEPEELPALDWIGDRDLIVFVDRLPLAQRQVLTLRYMFGFSLLEIAKILGRDHGDVRVLHMRALKFLRERLRAIGREPQGGRPIGVRRWTRHAQVLRHRRFALLKR